MSRAPSSSRVPLSLNEAIAAGLAGSVSSTIWMPSSCEAIAAYVLVPIRKVSTLRAPSSAVKPPAPSRMVATWTSFPVTGWDGSAWARPSRPAGMAAPGSCPAPAASGGSGPRPPPPATNWSVSPYGARPAATIAMTGIAASSMTLLNLVQSSNSNAYST